MIFIIIIILVIIVSFLLAWYSMRDYQDQPDKDVPQSLYLIRNLAAFTPESLAKAQSQALQISTRQGINPLILSFERLIKGQSSALVIYGPDFLLKSFPEWQLLELEDYTKTLDLARLQAFEVGPIKNNLHQTNEPRSIFQDLQLADNEYLFLQVVTTPIKAVDYPRFQATIRVVVSATDPLRRSEMAKHFSERLRLKANLERRERPQTSTQVYTAYQRRSLIPGEIHKFALKPSQISELFK